MGIKSRHGTSAASVLRYDKSYDEIIRQCLNDLSKNIWLVGIRKGMKRFDPNFMKWANTSYNDVDSSLYLPVDKFIRLPKIIKPFIYGLGREMADMAIREFKPYDELRVEYCNTWQADEINHILNIVSGQDATNLFNNANTRMGVGNDGTAPTDSDNGLIGTTFFKAVDATFPNAAASKAIRYEMTTTDTEATFATGWLEEDIDSGDQAREWLRANVDLTGGGGAKPSTESWTLRIEPNIA